MKLSQLLPSVAALTFSLFPVAAQQLKNPILFCTAVPMSNDSATQCSLVASHLGSYYASIRGGDLWIRYPNTKLKNLTKAAGFGSEGSQRTNAISVRQPCVHWSGKKAVFSMLVGGYAGYHDYHVEHWQMYEISGLAEQDTPVIKIVEHQPISNNNINPIYGSDDRILFISDKPRRGTQPSYDYLDESQCMQSTSGVWSLDPQSGDLQQLDHAPSGDYNLSLDSYGRLVFSRWDILQHDQLHTLSGGNLNSIDYAQESNNGGAVSRESEALFPEHNALLNFTRQNFSSSSGYFNSEVRPDALKTKTGTDGTLFDERLPSAFFPWTMNEDGSDQQTINHIGRHELRDTIPVTQRLEIGVVPFSAAATQRANKKSLVNLIQMREDPTQHGTYYAIDAATVLTHSSGQLVRLRNLSPQNNSNEVEVDYLSPRATRNLPAAASPGDGLHTGFYRNPLMTSNGVLLCAYSEKNQGDKQNVKLGTASNFHFRLCTMKSDQGIMLPDSFLTQGIHKEIYIVDINSQYLFEVDCSSDLWELDPAEVVVRERPHTRTSSIQALEQQVFDEEHVSVELFRNYLREKNQAVIVMRDLTQRDKTDHQQPFYLSVGKGAKQSAGSDGRAIEVENLSLFQADYVRSHALSRGAELPGRRVMAVPMHDALNRRYSADTAIHYTPSSNAYIETDGSAAAFVPAQRALSWQLSSPTGEGVVRERYWVSFKAGEVRTCGRCHGENSDATSLSMPPPSNTSAALRGLLHVWKQDHYPGTIRLQQPPQASHGVTFPLRLSWKRDSNAQHYELHVSARENNSMREVFSTSINAPDTSYILQDLSALTSSTDFQWEVIGVGKWGQSELSRHYEFSTSNIINDVADELNTSFSYSPNPCSQQLTLRYALASPSLALIVLRDNLGREVLRKAEPIREGDCECSLDTDMLLSGSYTLELQTAGVVLRRRVIVTH